VFFKIFLDRNFIFPGMQQSFNPVRNLIQFFIQKRQTKLLNKNEHSSLDKTVLMHSQMPDSFTKRTSLMLKERFEQL